MRGGKDREEGLGRWDDGSLSPGNGVHSLIEILIHISLLGLP